LIYIRRAFLYKLNDLACELAERRVFLLPFACGADAPRRLILLDTTVIGRPPHMSLDGIEIDALVIVVENPEKRLLAEFDM
jgi:hypothetical protein